MAALHLDQFLPICFQFSPLLLLELQEVRVWQRVMTPTLLAVEVLQKYAEDAAPIQLPMPCAGRPRIMKECMASLPVLMSHPCHRLDGGITLS